MKAIKNKTIAIVGGGPGGLTLARLLQMRGADVKVYERDSNRKVRVQGATLDLHHDSGLLALENAGLMDAFKANYRPGADVMCITDKYANVLLKEYAGSEGEAFRPEIDRGPLRDILLDSLQDNTVVWGSQFLNMVQTGNGWELSFKNGTTATADMVIAADGANSRIRPYITSIKPFYTGYCAIEGAVYNSATAIPKIHKILNGGKIFALSDARTLIVASKGDGSAVFYCGFKAEEKWAATSGINFTNNVEVKAWFANEFGGWTAWHELFEQAEPKFIVRPQYCMPPDQTWKSQANLTMLGDAAHLMPPYAGEGVNMAMLDALELANCLTDPQFADTQTAIEHFEIHMRERARETAQMTLQQTDLMHSDNGLDSMLNFFGGTLNVQ
ncbi:FAD-dependent oxidoreductase [Mucilaginibacter litoreus]|uniref:Flavin-dependent monooxygenase n=1 Tax=Mucilaginibacter litoreus TaxID=1048221 RepID=A0ABW3APT3_9SPHI